MREREIPILMYHNIGTPAPADRLPKLWVSTKTFQRQMALIKWLGFRGVSMRDAMPYLSGEIKNQKIVAITFDDGCVDVLEHALPILQRYGHTATCYFVSQRSGEYNAWDAEEIGARKSIMTIAQMKQWHDAGMEVGAHTQTHARLTECDEQTLAREVGDVKTELEDAVGAPVMHFCYPYGSYDANVVSVVERAGYATATTTKRGAATRADKMLELPRIKMTGNHLLKVLLRNF